MRTQEQWEQLVRANIYRVTPEQAKAIAALSFEAQNKGENCSVWHSSSRYFGHKCNCAVCRPTSPAIAA